MEKNGKGKEETTKTTTAEEIKKKQCLSHKKSSEKARIYITG